MEEPECPRHYDGELGLQLWPATARCPVSYIQLGFVVEDLSAAVQRLDAVGAWWTCDLPNFVRTFDPEGNKITLTQRRRREEPRMSACRGYLHTEAVSARGVRMAEFGYGQWRHRWPEVVVQRRTDEAVQLLKGYYAITAAGRPAYSGSQFEAMAALNTDPYSIGPADFTAASMLSVDIPAQAAIRLLGRDASDITDLLHQIPVDVDIIDIDPDELATGGPASLLWQVLRRGNDGMGRTRTSKLIAAKRPRLLPIWDSFVEQATGLDTVDYWRQFQAVLAADDRAIWTWLTQIRSDVPKLPAAVPNLRILDVLLWMTVDRQR